MNPTTRHRGTTPTPSTTAPRARHALPAPLPSPVLAVHHTNTTQPLPSIVPPRTLMSDLRAALDHPVWGTPLAVLAITPFGLMCGAVVAHIVGM